MPGTTTGNGPTAAATCARPGPATPPPTSPTSGSSADPSSAASSTNTNQPRRSPGQHQWPSSGTPQVPPGPRRAALGRRFRLPVETTSGSSIAVLDAFGASVTESSTNPLSAVGDARLGY